MSLMAQVGTGLDSFSNPQDIGALWPFEGYEILFVVAAVALWLLWHVWQTVSENREYRDALQLYRRVGMTRAMHFSGRAEVSTEEDIDVVKAQAVGAGEASVGGGDRPDAPTAQTGV